MTLYMNQLIIKIENIFSGVPTDFSQVQGYKTICPEKRSKSLHISLSIMLNQRSFTMLLKIHYHECIQ